MSISSLIIILGSILLIIVLLAIIYINRPTIFTKIIDEASFKSRFSPTFFEIYDKSTEDNCNRLIRVQPFDWIIWAAYGQVYVVGESIYDCPMGFSPAVKIPNQVTNKNKHKFQSVCLNIGFSDLVESFKDVEPLIRDYKIQDLQAEINKFTVLDALNYLFTKYLTMDPPGIVRSLSSQVQNIGTINKANILGTRLMHDYKPIFSKRQQEHFYKLATNAKFIHQLSASENMTGK